MKNFSVAVMVNGEAHLEFGNDEERGLVTRLSPQGLKVLEDAKWQGFMDSLGPVLMEAVAKAQAKQEKAAEATKLKIAQFFAQPRELTELEQKTMQVHNFVSQAQSHGDEAVIDKLLEYALSLEPQVEAPAEPAPPDPPSPESEPAQEG